MMRKRMTTQEYKMAMIRLNRASCGRRDERENQ